jgi:hypothetical protein
MCWWGGDGVWLEGCPHYTAACGGGLVAVVKVGLS